MQALRVFGVIALLLGGVMSIAAPAQATLGPWVQVAAGDGHTCGINTSGSLYCWGNNSSGQVGDGTTNTPRLSLHRVGAAGVWTSITAGGSHTCGITKAKNLYCWGYNQFGQAGDGTTNTPRLSLHRVGAAGAWTSITAGNHHTCGITKAKNLYCWGYNQFGQAGDGTTNTPRLSLHRVGAAGAWTSITAGSHHTCGITTAKNLYCWGNNGSGQVGDGTTNTPRLSLHRVGAAGVWTSITAGFTHTCGITKAKNLYCWGFNFYGQVGDGTTTTPRLSWHRVGAAGVWTSITAGNHHTCGITTAKNLYCWGNNGSGQVGDGTTNTPRLGLYRVGVAGVWNSITAGGSHTCAIATGNDAYCWGYNQYGQVGDGTTNTPRLAPFRVT